MRAYIFILATSVVGCVDGQTCPDGGTCDDGGTTDNTSSGSSATSSSSGTTTTASSGNTGNSTIYYGASGVAGSSSSSSGSASSSGVAGSSSSSSGSNVVNIPQWSSETFIPYDIASSYNTCDSYCSAHGQTCVDGCVDAQGCDAGMQFACILPGNSVPTGCCSTDDSSYSSSPTIYQTSSCMTSITTVMQGMMDPLTDEVCYAILSDGSIAPYGGDTPGLVPANTVSVVYFNYVQCCCQ